jgi:hypothetical protein
MRMATALALATVALSVPGNSPAPQFTEDGQLQLPEDYREWVFRVLPASVREAA